MGYHNRKNHWTCSQFADWLRGTVKPGFATGLEWHRWERDAKAQHPIRFWIADSGLRSLQDFVNWPLDKIYDAKYYLRNRFVDQTHALVAHAKHLKRGQWCDVGDRFLPCLFDELVDFVEIEQARWYIACDKEAAKRYKAPFWSRGFFKSGTWRCPEAGIEHLKWAANLTYGTDDFIEPEHELYDQYTPQAVAAQEILELYKWYTTVYSNRLDPHDASGWTAQCLDREAKYGSMLFSHELETPEEREASSAALARVHAIEAAYDAEDTEMLCRLIRVRQHLWT